MADRAFCFDLSGTITKEEIMPLLAKHMGIYDEVQTITEAVVKGQIPPTKSFLLRSELVNKLGVSQSQEILSTIELHPKILDFIQNNSQNCFVVTLALDVWLQKLTDIIPCQFSCSKANYDDDEIIGIESIIDKSESIEKIKRDFDEVVAIGGDMGDVSMLEKADISIAFVSVHDPVSSLIEVSDFVTFSEAGLCNVLNTLL